MQSGDTPSFEALFEQRSLCRVVGESERSPVGAPGLVRAAEFPEERGTCCVEQVMVRQLGLERFDLVQRLLCPGDVAQRDRSVKSCDWRAGAAAQLVIEEEDLRPIGALEAWRLSVAGGDRGLELVRPGAKHPRGPDDQRRGAADRGVVPLPPVLVA